MMELLVVILIICLLSILGIVQYLKTVENSRADQAINAIQQMAAAEHMYALDVQNPAGLPTGQITDLCNGPAASPTTAKGCPGTRCMRPALDQGIPPVARCPSARSPGS